MAKGVRVILPSEHGSWSLMLIPFVIGAGVALVGSRPANGAAIALAFIAVMALFLARQPLTLWMRSRSGKAIRTAPGVTLQWSLALLALAGAAGLGLLALGRVEVLWLAVPAAAILVATLALGAALGPRQLVTELLGVVGLALAAPAAYVAGTGVLDAAAGAVWALTALHATLSILYVRLRIHQRHGRVSPGEAPAAIAAHALGVAGVLAGTYAGWLPALTALPFAVKLARVATAAWRNPSIESLRRFGFTEMGLALAFAALVITAFALAH